MTVKKSKKERKGRVFTKKKKRTDYVHYICRENKDFMEKEMKIGKVLKVKTRERKVRGENP